MRKWFLRNERWFQIVTTGIFLFMFAFMARDCAGRLNITTYDGWQNECELRGGVVHAMKCFDPDALISVGITNKGEG